VIRVALVDDEALVRAGLRLILESASDIEVVDEAEDGAEASMVVRRSRPDVVLMDIRMPRLGGQDATREITAEPGAPQVMILTTFDADDQVFRALAGGAAGYLLKDTPPTELIQAVRRVAAGEGVLSPSVTRKVIQYVAGEGRSPHRQEAAKAVAHLTEREREVLVQVGQGATNAEIAKALDMSEATAKSHLTHLFQKLRCTNRVQLTIIAFRAGLAE
jgi:DNA-binding NarL/FixJ family response regulator